MRLIASLIMRRSSSIWVSPGPPRVPVPPCWRSRWLQRRTRRVLRYCRRASSTCSLPSWLRARCANISRMSMVRSLTGMPRVRSRLRCCAGLSAWSNRISVAPCCSASSLISSALPLPTNKAGSGALRLQVIRATGSRPAVWASSPSSSSSASKCGRPKSTPTRTARGAAFLSCIRESGHQEKGGARRADADRAGDQAAAESADSPASGATEKLTARPGTMVEMACL